MLEPIAVLCVDDNEHIREALRLWLARERRYRWAGSLDSADDLAQRVQDGPSIVLLDIDMPGRSAFDALAELSTRKPEARVIIFSGHVRLELIDRAIEAGAWGYVSKNDGEQALFGAMDRVASDEIVFSAEARALLGKPA